MKLALFGGSFDPVHLGHLKIISLAKKMLAADKIILIPNACPPHKRLVTAASDRYMLLLLASEKIDYTEVSPYEMDGRKAHYTEDTIRYFLSRYGRDLRYYILGADSLAELHSWKNGFKLFDLIKFAVFDRENNIRKLKKQFSKYENRIKYINFDCNISSSAIRTSKSENLNKLVPGRVLKYIKLHGLYNA